MIRSKLAYLCILIFFALFAVLYDEYITFIIFTSMVMLPLVLWISGFVVKYYVDMQIETDSLIENKGQPFAIIVRFHNRSILPVPRAKFILKYRNLFDMQTGTQTITTALDSKSDTVLSLSVNSDYCGMMEFEINKVIMYDYIGLWQFRKKIQGKAQVSVLPTLCVIEEQIAIDNPNVLVDSELFSNAKSGDDPSELYGFRMYEAGDKMNRIHWKLSLKQDELVVKQFGYPINCAVAILIDFYHVDVSDGLQIIDTILETVLSLSISMVLQGQIHFISWYDKEKEICHKEKIEKEEDVYEVLARLFRLKIMGQQQSMLNFFQAQYEREEFTNLLYVGTGFTIQEAELLGNIKKSAITHIFSIETQLQEDADHTAAIRFAEGMHMHAVCIHAACPEPDLISFGAGQD